MVVARAARRVAAVAALVAVLVLGTAGAAHADATAVAGSAAGVSASLTAATGGAVTLPPAPSVTLPRTGSAEPVTGSAAPAALPGLLETGVITVVADGAPGSSASVRTSAQVAGLVVGGSVVPVLTADAVGSTCTSTETGSTGEVTVAELTVLGVPLTVATAPDTAVTIPGVGVLHVNEQVVTGAAPSSGITVTGLRLELAAPRLATGEIVVARSVCGVTGTGVVVPTGAVGGMLLTGAVAVVFGAGQIRRYRRGSPLPG